MRIPAEMRVRPSPFGAKVTSYGIHRATPRKTHPGGLLPIIPKMSCGILPLGVGRSILLVRTQVIVLAFFAAVALAVTTAGGLRQDVRLKKIVVLSNATVTERAFDGLRHGLAEAGWHEGASVRFIHPEPSGSPSVLRARARELIDGDTALVVALSTPAALSAREVATELGIPMLLAPVSDPVATGLVSSLTHPGQAITGITFALQELRRLELLTQLAPGVRRIWVPYDSTDPSPVAAIARLTGAAAKLGVTLVTADIRSPAQLRGGLDTLPDDIDAIFVPPDASLASHTRAIVAAASIHGLPVTVPHADGVTQGALFSYGFDLYTLGRQAARLADQILSGTPATDLPIETADMELTVNLAIANRLGLNIPDDVLRHATIIGRPGE